MRHVNRRLAKRRGVGWFGLSILLLICASGFALGDSSGSTVQAASSDPKPLSIELITRNDSGVTGVATIAASGDETRLVVNITAGDDEYLPYLHRGTCESFDDEGSIPLSIATATIPGETTIDLSTVDLTSGRYVVDLHVASGSLASLMDPETSVACGAIAIDDAAGTLQPPVAGIGPIGSDHAKRVAVSFALIALVTCFAGLRVRRVPRPVEAVVTNEVARERLRGIFT